MCQICCAIFGCPDGFVLPSHPHLSSLCAQGFTINDFRGRTGWACPNNIPPPCQVSGDQASVSRGLGPGSRAASLHSWLECACLTACAVCCLWPVVALPSDSDSLSSRNAPFGLSCSATAPADPGGPQLWQQRAVGGVCGPARPDGEPLACTCAAVQALLSSVGYGSSVAFWRCPILAGCERTYGRLMPP